MRERIVIYSGLFLFLVLMTAPFTINLLAGKTPRNPDLNLPENEKQCVAPTAYMKSSHMQLLLDWRENRVRRNIRAYVTFDGRQYPVSLTGVCMDRCHKNKAEFCDRCHNYAGVQGPYCMDCHIDSAKIQRSGL
jgi:hypothetical protein